MPGEGPAAPGSPSLSLFLLTNLNCLKSNSFKAFLSDTRSIAGILQLLLFIMQ